MITIAAINTMKTETTTPSAKNNSDGVVKNESDSLIRDVRMIGVNVTSPIRNEYPNQIFPRDRLKEARRTPTAKKKSVSTALSAISKFSVPVISDTMKIVHNRPVKIMDRTGPDVGTYDLTMIPRNTISSSKIEVAEKT